MLKDHVIEVEDFGLVTSKKNLDKNDSEPVHMILYIL